MTDPGRPAWRVVLQDAQFWIPVAALAAGLLVLRWIQ